MHSIGTIGPSELFSYNTTHLSYQQIQKDKFSIPYIEKLPDKLSGRYDLLDSIPIEVNQVAPESYVARFVGADISMAGSSRDNARDELAETIVDFLETFQDDPRFKDDVSAIRFYIEKCNDPEE